MLQPKNSISLHEVFHEDSFLLKRKKKKPNKLEVKPSKYFPSAILFLSLQFSTDWTSHNRKYQGLGNLPHKPLKALRVPSLRVGSQDNSTRTERQRGRLKNKGVTSFLQHESVYMFGRAGEVLQYKQKAPTSDVLHSWPMCSPHT